MEGVDEAGNSDEDSGDDDDPSEEDAGHAVAATVRGMRRGCRGNVSY